MDFLLIQHRYCVHQAIHPLTDFIGVGENLFEILVCERFDNEELMLVVLRRSNAPVVNDFDIVPLFLIWKLVINLPVGLNHFLDVEIVALVNTMDLL